MENEGAVESWLLRYLIIAETTWAVIRANHLRGSFLSRPSSRSSITFKVWTTEIYTWKNNFQNEVAVAVVVCFVIVSICLLLWKVSSFT